MKPDRYTKAVLTVIAGCLVYFVARDLGIVANAYASNAIVDVNIVKIDGNSLHSSSTTDPVRIAK